MLAGSGRCARLDQLTTVTTDAYDVAEIIGLSKVERMLVRTFPRTLSVRRRGRRMNVQNS